jgi:hypothetical protein
MQDLQSTRWMWLKAALFLMIGMASVTLILLRLPEWRVAILLALAIWSFCRLYYFAFYVLERYIDPTYRFSGILSAIRFLMGRKNQTP